ncbi:sigma-70 family RNA polymerase sigma factor [Tuwongella immobilis]|uniref:RNA polymerase sigma factor 70 region 4 type 2 domain-containing protein n=1 Tax=Tuwongella immobilis TaxID=692036 RepID=A0A6C2YTC7_9BACT|nr:sigma-70 family RNA polymerase sigma factor [Tuwongella immobilis]VIP04289.1 rna-polymerase sigma-e factor : Probable RNA polymerase sigma-E factor OS=Planctomyces maris DSM 8797 GN=PM8797T_31815 PE=4 SV=1: Sigma70_r2: Sigma70_r4_2 [Tuwongella immobilis]VTS05941.1 rna-polymerase sigma-e factor : Probable RNA polymerase sigma-E factor OS=Planctomyces maris DSM 8797 GN=PM8797T_31815 PE=4 SV=1: Sigma70_r2: Sigma70_r4_2 [Tuwongella immobilis]
MTESESMDEFPRLLAAARAGDRSALGQLLSRVRAEMLRAAELAMPADLRPKASGADVLQETFLEAQQLIARFQGETFEQFQAWMRAVLRNKLADFERSYRKASKRSVAREYSLESPEMESTPIPESDPPLTASGQVRAMEDAEALQRAMAQLPEDYQRILKLRNWDGLSFSEIGTIMNRSEDAARMLWGRAIERLRVILEKAA